MKQVVHIQIRNLTLFKLSTFIPLIFLWQLIKIKYLILVKSNVDSKIIVINYNTIFLPHPVYILRYYMFRYFQIYMTPEDFLRSLTPGMIQPQGLGLDQFKKVDASTMDFKNMIQKLPKDSIFYKLGAAGLISFSDYIFLLTILSTSR